MCVDPGIYRYKRLQQIVQNKSLTGFPLDLAAAVYSKLLKHILLRYILFRIYKKKAELK